MLSYRIYTQTCQVTQDQSHTVQQISSKNDNIQKFHESSRKEKAKKIVNQPVNEKESTTYFSKFSIK